MCASEWVCVSPNVKFLIKIPHEMRSCDHHREYYTEMHASDAFIQQNSIASCCSIVSCDMIDFELFSSFLHMHKFSCCWFFFRLFEVLLIKHVNHYRQITKEISTIATQFCCGLKIFKWKSKCVWCTFHITCENRLK